MTDEKAIIILNSLKQYYNDKNEDSYVGFDDEDNEAIDIAIKAIEQQPILDKIRAEIVACLKALDDIEKSRLNIYLPNEMSGRRLTYQQCLDFIDKYKTESENKACKDCYYNDGDVHAECVICDKVESEDEE